MGSKIESKKRGRGIESDSIQVRTIRTVVRILMRFLVLEPSFREKTENTALLRFSPVRTLGQFIFLHESPPIETSMNRKIKKEEKGLEKDSILPLPLPLPLPLHGPSFSAHRIERKSLGLRSNRLPSRVVLVLQKPFP